MAAESTGQDRSSQQGALETGVAAGQRSLPLWNNPVSMLGLFMVVSAVILLMTFALFSAITQGANPYVDIVGFLILPGILLAGLVITPLGILIKSWWIRRRHPEQRLTFSYPRIDLNDAAQRRSVKIVMFSTFLLLPVMGVTGYHGYHYTDSTEFCARACHAVMKPQATAHVHSPHARVACADCHIGSGASWFVKSKLSGTRQVFAVLRDTYSRPIPPAIHNLRPARETCEQCHWPQKFYGAQLVERVHFRSDEQNTRHEISMLVKTGGGDEATGRLEGIHLHMALTDLEFVATDEQLQVIPWVRLLREDGSEIVYRSDGKPSAEPPPDGVRRKLDCMDCHNRAAHPFRSPSEAVNIALDIGKIDQTLPYIKREAVRSLLGEYADETQALKRIGSHLETFYKNEYPQLWDTRRASIEQAILVTRDIYQRSAFPGMKVDWRTYPDNIGHLNSPGCFRCHDGRHVDENGAAISHDCGVCHSFLNPVPHGNERAIQPGAYQHPFELTGVHAGVRCDQCHAGGMSPSPTCEGCHSEVSGFRDASAVEFARFKIEPDSMATVVGCEGCHDVSMPVATADMEAVCMDCHDDDPERFEGMLGRWKQELEPLLVRALRLARDEDRAAARALQEAGPYHNVEGARKILNGLLSGDSADESRDSVVDHK